MCVFLSPSDRWRSFCPTPLALFLSFFEKTADSRPIVEREREWDEEIALCSGFSPSQVRIDQSPQARPSYYMRTADISVVDWPLARRDLSPRDQKKPAGAPFGGLIRPQLLAHDSTSYGESGASIVLIEDVMATVDYDDDDDDHRSVVIFSAKAPLNE